MICRNTLSYRIHSCLQKCIHTCGLTSSNRNAHKDQRQVFFSPLDVLEIDHFPSDHQHARGKERTLRDYRVKRGYGRDLRRAAPEEEGEQLRELLADKEQQVSRAMRSRQTQTVAHVKTLTLTLALLSPTGATLKEAGALRALRSSWLKSRKGLINSCFDKN